jgi:type VI secretion system protein ImpF
MADAPLKDRLQPSLLDRLTDNEPENRKETSERRAMSLRDLRQTVLRDLSWLFNAVCLESVQSLEECPQVRHSTLNFGIPDLSGHHVSGADATDIERSIRQAIVDFEPRILKNTLKVRVVAVPEQYNHNAMNFDIEGDLWMQPLPLRIYLKTQIDLETGDVNVIDKSV